jgi:Ni,Fe-hydrogenase III large subunit
MTLSSPRIGKAMRLRSTLARLAARRRLAAFVAPDRAVALALGVDLEAAGLHLVATPRHADVLVLVGPIPPGLESAIALTYAQMPRPRARLPVAAGATQAEVQAAVARLSSLFADGAWPEQASERSSMDHSTMDHVGGGHDMSGMAMDMDMQHMDMSGGGFMSMVMMTQDLPRSADGLPMEWLEVPFGPLFPGLPGGLGLMLTLDGDTVAAARVEAGALSRGLREATWPGPVDGFAERFAALDPLSPIAYRVLAEMALAAASGADATVQRGRIGALERERAASHLRWIAAFGFLLGDRSLEERATVLHRHLARARDVTALRRVRDDVGALVQTPLLRLRLSGVGRVDTSQLADLDGPIARAAGLTGDLRSDEPAYRGFKPAVVGGNDAMARLQVRLAELEQSLDFLLATSSDNKPVEVARSLENGVGEAAIETPRGAARLRIEVRQHRIVSADLASPSQRLVELVSTVGEGRELADALLGVASLDLSPWEIDR